MAVTLMQDAFGDIDISSGKVVLTTNKKDTSLQQIKLRLGVNRGTWYRDISFGIPLMKNSNNPIQLLGRTPKEVFDSYIQEGVLNAEFITGIVAGTYKSSYDNNSRTLIVSFSAITEEGIIEVTNQEIALT